MLTATRSTTGPTPFLHALPVVPEVTDKKFGLLIAYGIPGFISLWGASFVSPTVSAWLSPVPTLPGSLEAVFFVSVASLAAGMAASAFRWVLIDQLHNWTGLPLPHWDDANLQPNLDAFDTVVQAHYRYYQFHANSAVALAFAFFAWHISRQEPFALAPLHDGAFVAIEAVLLLTSRDNLRKYYARAARILGVRALELERRNAMSNGNHPKPAPKPRPVKPSTKTTTKKTK